MREAHKQQKQRAKRATLDGNTVEELRRRIGHSPEISKRINRSGDTMQGPLSVVTPTLASHAATKSFVDNGVATRINRDGDAMNAPLTGPQPTAPGHYARKAEVDGAETAAKSYSDVQTATRISRSGDAMNAPLAGPAPTAASHYARKADVDGAETSAKNYADTQDATRVSLGADQTIGGIKKFNVNFQILGDSGAFYRIRVNTAGTIYAVLQ